MSYETSKPPVLNLWSIFLKRWFWITLFVWGPSALWADVVESKKDGVKVFEEAQKNTAVVKTLKKGEQLEVVGRQGLYWKVKVDKNKHGFVKFTQVKRSVKAGSAIAVAIQQAAQDSRDMDQIKSARSRSAVMGIRGLDESQDSALAGNVVPNMRLVYSMEDRRVPKQKLERLQRLVQSELERKLRKKSQNK